GSLPPVCAFEFCIVAGAAHLSARRGAGLVHKAAGNGLVGCVRVLRHILRLHGMVELRFENGDGAVFSSAGRSRPGSILTGEVTLACARRLRLDPVTGGDYVPDAGPGADPLPLGPAAGDLPFELYILL